MVDWKVRSSGKIARYPVRQRGRSTRGPSSISIRSSMISLGHQIEAVERSGVIFSRSIKMDQVENRPRDSINDRELVRLYRVVTRGPRSSAFSSPVTSMTSHKRYAYKERSLFSTYYQPHGPSTNTENHVRTRLVQL